jgi:hypothetical protein
MWRDATEHLTRQRVLTPEADACCRGAAPIDHPHGPGTQVEAQIERHDDPADRERAGEIAEPLVITRMLRRAVLMVVLPFESEGRVILVTSRVIEIEVNFLRNYLKTHPNHNML